MGKIERRENKEFYILIFPWFAIFIAMGLVPLIYGFYLSFTNFAGFNFDHLKNVGLRNYHTVFTDSDAMYSLGRSFTIGFINIMFSTFIGFMIAVLLNNRFKAIGFFRSLYYLPAILPITAVSLMWRTIFENNGILNNLLKMVGVHPINWLGYDYATFSLLIMLIWGCGGGIIIYLAGLKGISPDLYEAAAIDGAGAFQRLRNITLPMMTPVIFFNLVLGIIHSLQIFLQAQVLTGTVDKGMLAVPIRPNYLYLIHAFQQIFAFHRYGYGLALLWVLFVITVFLTLIIFGTSRFWVHNELDERKGTK